MVDTVIDTGDKQGLREGFPKEYPCDVVWIWECESCHTIFRSTSYYVTEPGDDDSDGLDHHCECGEYYKKIGKIEAKFLHFTGWVPNHPSTVTRNPTVTVTPILDHE